MLSEFVEIIIKSNTLNFLIVAALMWFLLSKIKTGEKLQNMAEDIKSYVETSENEKINAAKQLEIITTKIEKLNEVEERIKKSTQNSVKNYENKVQRDIESQKSDISKTSQRLLNFETKKFKNELSDLLSLQSVDIAKANAINTLKNNTELQNKYIDSAIKELDGINL